MSDISPSDLKRLFKNASRTTIKLNQAGGAGLRTAQPQPAKGNALERALPRKAKGGNGAIVCPEPSRCRIQFTVYAVRPCDWDGYHIKEIQDMLVKAGLLDGDEWNLLQGEVISEKVHSAEEERTEILIHHP